MTFLSDRDILAEMERGNIICTPFESRNLSNSSLDLRLGEHIITQRSSTEPIDFDLDEHGKITVKNNKDRYQTHRLKSSILENTKTEYILNPSEFALAQTLEYVGQPSDRIISEVADKSTLARLGLSVCFSAGYIDAGNVLNITLELKNNGNVPIELKYGMHICQLKFAYLSSPVLSKYSGKYLNNKTTRQAL